MTGKYRLRCPAGISARIRRAHQSACRVPRDALSPAGVWMEDQALFLLEEADALERSLRFAPRLPGREGTPRLLLLARKVCGEDGGDVTAAGIVRLLREELGEGEITQDELNLLPAALSCALMEQLDDALSSFQREQENRAVSRQWADALSDGQKEELPKDETLLGWVLFELSQREDSAALRLADERLSAQGRRAEDVSRAFQETLTEAGARMGRIVNGLRGVRFLSFDAVQERLSPVIRELRRDKTYSRMDADSRAYYGQCAVRIAKRLRVRESAAARAAVTLAEGKDGIEGEAGYYLIERPDLIAVHLLKRKKPSWTMRRRTALFLAPLYGGAVLSLAAAVCFGAPWYTWLLIPLCVSELLRCLEYALIRRLLPARMLPRIRVKKLSDENRTLVVIPCLLTSRKQAMRMARHLAVLRCAAPDRNIEFMLLADFADNREETAPQDEEIILAARLSIEALNRQYGDGFAYLHRARKWDMGQRAFTGRERKRGALEALNRLILEGKSADTFLFMSMDGETLKGRYQYVITLDADTFLPPGAARQLVGTMLHPLQKNRVCVVQPRMETAADSVRTRVQKLLSGRGGTDPYHLAVQDVYQDVFGRGSFVGKGIYEPNLWMERTKGRMPTGRLLSHDLIEGETVGSALADDIALYDGHPASLSGWQKRLHRWTRGDWQLLPFLKDGRLSLLSRHKIWDNLRRSLLPAARTLLLIAGAGLGNPILCLLALPWPIRGMLRRLFVTPGSAYTQLDAAGRALYRQFVSHRNLLSWVTAAQAEQGGDLPLPCVLFQIGAGTALTALSLLPGGFWPAAFIGLAWVASPLLIPFLNRPADAPRPLTPAMEADARKLARETWRFFETAVTADTLHLPPDNVQEDPDKGPALRTSPTNMGLYLLSCCAAREMKLISAAELAHRITDTLNTLARLETWKGHFYNWYDLRDGAALAPRFVSTVDSGNLMGCLLCCAQLLRSQLAQLPEESRDLPVRLDALANRMDFSALYDEKAHLFYIGWETEENRPTPAHYDCLASEARLASFLAIMTGQAERKHWRFLDRSVTRAGGGAALLSWGGTMFEYLLPNLLLPLTPGTLLGEGCVNAVRAQMIHDAQKPFGISESGYYGFDPELNYQYRAFGLPLLAHSHETAGSVIAPYASLLALPYFPRAVGENMKRMEKLGWRDEHGFFEAADYTPQRMETGPRIVKSHMAHHQGMILCSLCNALEKQALSRAFMTLPAAQAYSYLLLERAPASARRRIALPPPREEQGADAPSMRPARQGLPLEAQALSGGGMTWVVTPQGQGYLAAGKILLTRFDAQAGAQTGMQLYLRDRKNGAVIRPNVAGVTSFGEGQAHSSLLWRDLKISLRFCVDPLLGIAEAMLEIENPGGEEREIEAASFLEIAQGTKEADEAHPNFRDLSVRVTPWGNHGLSSRRLPRDEQDETPLIGHWIMGDVFALRRQGDRTLFLGRLGSYTAPEQMDWDMEDAAYRTGDVIAPCLSLRARVRVPAEGTARVCFLTAARNTEEELNDLPMTKRRLREAFSLAAVQNRMTLRFLRVDANWMPLYRQILGALMFYDQPHQSLLAAAPRNALWQIGVSGTLPVLLISLLEGADQTLIRHALRCHTWMRMQGVAVDLIFFCPEEKEYARPVHEKVLALVDAYAERGMLGQPGGVFLAEGNETQLRAMESLARLTLKGGRSLKDQLSALRTRIASPENSALGVPDPVTPLKLNFDNSIGGFTGEGAYCVKTPAPSPWHHLVCGPVFGTLVCETGILQSYAGNSRLGRLTRVNPDVHRGVPSEEIFLKLEDGTAYPLTRCAALYEPGVAAYRCMAADVFAETTVFSHVEKPLGVRAVSLRGEKEQTVSLYWLVRFAIGEHPETTRCQAAESIVYAKNSDMPGVAWAAMDGARCQSLSAAVCFGISGEEAPPALENNVQGVGSAALLYKEITLRPRETLRLTMALGHAPEEETARKDIEALLSEGAAQAERNTRASWAGRLAGIQVFGIDEKLQLMMNLWLPYQVWAARLFSRMGPYQAGGAFGFRDQLQDCLALLYTDPDFVRNHILLCAAHQFPEGDAQHWWHAPNRGVRTRISDDKLFLPYLTAKYVTATGDADILYERIPYLLSQPLGEEEKERYEEPEVSQDRESLLSHCLRAIDSVTFGPHSLPLMGTGDWNDGLNRVGGESVWLAFFLALTLKEFAPLCPQETKEKYHALRRKLLDDAESAWTGAWYLRAWKDGGEALGGPDTAPPRIDLICQCFAALAGAPRDHARTALIHAVDLLYDRDAGLVKLLDPPFAPEENAGYIGAYLPGVRENGGQYTHAVPWLILALCQLGEYALAWEIAKAVLPLNHSDTKEKALVYKIEPYVLAGDVYAGENPGRGGWSWYTGSAAWLYWTVLSALLGFEKRGDKARLTPRCAPDAEEFTLTYRFGSANYHFTAARDTLFPTLDGIRLEDGWARLISDGRTHEARFPMRST